MNDLIRKGIYKFRQLTRRPFLATPDTLNSEFIWQEIFNVRIYASTFLKINDNATIFDVGANIGIFAAWAAKEWNPRNIFCFEASPVTFRYLERNLRSIGVSQEPTKVQGTNVAVSNGKSTTLTIYHNSAGIASSTVLAAGKSHGVPYEVNVTTISKELKEKQLSHIDLIKIDVEGHYMEVLEGIESEDLKKISNMVIECDWIPEGGGSLSEVKKFLEKGNFEIEVDEKNRTNNFTVFARRKK